MYSVRCIRYLERDITTAALRVHCGIRFSSVRIEKRSSAEIIKLASIETVVVLVAFFAAGFGFGATGTGAAEVPAAGTGVPDRLGSCEFGVLTVISLPCVLIKMVGNSANLVSRAVERRFFASA
jgi:hypothetical protein